MKKMTIGSQLTSTLKPFSGEPRVRKATANLRSADWHQSITDSGSLMKKESGTEAGGDQSTDPLTQKKRPHSNLEVKEEILQIKKQTSKFPLWIRTKELKWHLQISQDLSPATLTNQVPASLVGTMAQITATMTVTSAITRTTRAGPSAGGIWDSIKQDLKHH